MLPVSGSLEELKHSSPTKEDGSEEGNRGGSPEDLFASDYDAFQPSSSMLVKGSSGGVTAVDGRLNKTGIQNHGPDSDMARGNFDPRSYVKRLIQTNESLSLLKLDDEMVRSIRKLDSDIHMLVYENYNKFINATDTIRKMKQNVEAMESDIKRLDEFVHTISTASNSINAILQDKRVRVDKLVRVRRLLHRLHFLFELPDKLTDALEMGSVTQAIEYYTTARETLKAHSHVSSLAVIAQESNEIMNSLKLRLSSSIEGEPYTISQADFIESISYLLRLGAPVSSLVERYVVYHRELVEGWLDSSRHAVSDDPSSSLDFTMGQLAKGFLPLLVRTKTAFDRLFGSIENRDTDDDEELSDCLMKGKSDLLIVLSNCSYSFFELLECTDERAVISPSDGLLAGKGRKCSKTGGVDVGLQTIASSSEDVTDMAIDDVGLRSTVVTLEQFFFDVQRVDAAIGGVGLSARCATFVEGAKQRRMKIFFEAIKVSTNTNVSALTSLAENDLEFTNLKEMQNISKRFTGYQVIVQNAVENISAAVERAVTESMPLIQGGGADQECLVEQLHTNVWHFMCWLVRCFFAFSGVPDAITLPVLDSNGKNCQLQQDIEAMMGLEQNELTWPSAKVAHPRAILTLACACREAGKQLVPAAVEVLARYSALALHHLSLILIRKTVGKHEIMRLHFDNASKAILSHYVEIVGGRLASLWGVGLNESTLLDQMEDFPLLDEPVLRVLTGLDIAAADVAAVLGEMLGGRGEKEGYIRALGASTIGGVHGTKGQYLLGYNNRDLQLNIDRIFASEIVVMGGRVKYNADDILGTVLKVICKAIEQDLRRVILSKEGFQQVQVDVEVLQLAASALVKDIALVSDIQSLLDAVMVAADERAVEVMPMRQADAFGFAESVITKHLNNVKGDYEKLRT